MTASCDVVVFIAMQWLEWVMATERGAKLTAQIALGNRLRRVRLRQGLEQKEVAARLGMSESNYGRYENGWNESRIDPNRGLRYSARCDPKAAHR
jgi:DNA-binding XRE family transcriptional regulator